MHTDIKCESFDFLSQMFPIKLCLFIGFLDYFIGELKSNV